MKSIDPIERAAIERTRQAHYAASAAKQQADAPAETAQGADDQATETRDPLDHDGDGKPGGDASAADGLTKVEIIADLIAMEVDHDPRALKADLLALRNEARARRDAAQ